MPQHRSLSLTVALDWPKSGADGKVFTAAIEAEFALTKERRFDFPTMGVGVTAFSRTLPGNRDAPRIWRRLIRYLQNAHVISPASDPWCYGAKVILVDEEPHVIITIKEEA